MPWISFPGEAWHAACPAPGCWLRSIAECWGPEQLLSEQRKRICVDMSGVGQKQCKKIFFFPSNLEDDFTNAVAKQCCTAVGDEAFCLKWDAEGAAIRSGKSIAQSPVWPKKGCPCSAASFRQGCSKAVLRWKIYGGFPRGKIIATICRVACSILSCHKLLWVWKGCCISFEDMIIFSWQMKQPFV